MRGLRRLRNLWRGDALAREFDDEIAFHFEQRIAAKLGHPDTDPHGHCIPALDGTMPARHGVSCRCGLD